MTSLTLRKISCQADRAAIEAANFAFYSARQFFVLFLMRFCYNVGVFDQKATSEIGAHRDREEILTGFIQTQR
jgi:uncharacterized membrane protein